MFIEYIVVHVHILYTLKYIFTPKIKIIKIVIFNISYSKIIYYKFYMLINVVKIFKFNSVERCGSIYLFAKKYWYF